MFTYEILAKTPTIKRVRIHGIGSLISADCCSDINPGADIGVPLDGCLVDGRLCPGPAGSLLRIVFAECATLIEVTLYWVGDETGWRRSLSNM